MQTAKLALGETDAIDHASTAWSTRLKVCWWSAVVALVGVLASFLRWDATIFGRAEGCRNLEVIGGYAGSSGAFARFRDAQLCSSMDLSGFHRHLFIGGVLALVYGAVLFSISRFWWPKAWLSEPFTSVVWMKWVGVAAAAFDIIENNTLAIVIHTSTPVISNGTAHFLPIISWSKTLCLATAWLAAFATLLAAFSRRRLSMVLSEGSNPYADLPVAGLGVCCSGGGIRAASIALGALGALERTRLVQERGVSGELVSTGLSDAHGKQGILYQAEWLASVSGGGYAAGAWRVASASLDGHRSDHETEDEAFERLWPEGVLGNPRSYPTIPPVAADTVVGRGVPSLFRHLQQRREYLRTGRGGFPASALLLIGFLAFHLLILAAGVIAIAWPVGHLAATWFVTGDLSTKTAIAQAAEKITGQRVHYHTSQRLWSVTAFYAAAAVLAFAPCLLQWNTRRRSRLMILGWCLLGASAFTGFLLTGVPWLIQVVYPSLKHHSFLNSVGTLGSVGGAAAVAIGLARRWARSRLAYLGGALLAVATAVFALIVAGSNANDEPSFFRLNAPFHGPHQWLLLIALLGVGYFSLCPRWWSPHTLYRNRLRSAFITTRDKSYAPTSLQRHTRVVSQTDGEAFVDEKGTAQVETDGNRLWPFRQSTEPLLDAYYDCHKPIHLVCASAARRKGRGTGVRALSFVMSARSVEYYDVDYTSGADMKVTTYSTPTKRWIEALGSDRARQAEGTVSAAISVSGAAFSPAMGRFNLGTTNALLAALNMRLGSWLPNPRYIPVAGDVRFPWVRLSYLAKELVGRYDLSDHHLYVTDGGHRENLGLVELLRRRCRTIICVDASGDTPGTYTTLRQAADLARIEVGAEIDLHPLLARQATFEPMETARGGPASVPLAGSIVVEAPKMTLPGAHRPQVAHTVLKVTYRNAIGPVTTGTIIHIAPVMFEQLPDDLIAYGLEDPLFPHYSTGDQFLSEEQFRRLVIFGSEATGTALRTDNEVRVEIAEAIGT
jgi:hypothetical protein